MDDLRESPAPSNADPALHDLFRRWAERARTGRLPSAEELDFDGLIEACPGAALISLEPQPDGSRRYIYSRVGKGHGVALGRDIKGYSIDELVAPQQVAYYENVYDRIVAERKPHYWMRMNSLVGSQLHTFERLLVPVASDGKTVDGLVGIWVWLEESAQAT